MDRKPFTIADAIKVQADQLRNWKTKLNDECYQDLEKFALASNEGQTQPYAIVRGTELSNFIGNWKGGDSENNQ